MRNVDMTIGKLAKEAGVGVETVRFYERKGMIRRPSRQAGGFRHYEPADAIRIRFIKRSQELGFTLREVKDLLALQSTRNLTGSRVKDKCDEKVKEIKQKIADLKRMERALHRLAKTCGEGEQAMRECKIFDCLEGC